MVKDSADPVLFHTANETLIIITIELGKDKGLDQTWIHYSS